MTRMTELPLYLILFVIGLVIALAGDGPGQVTSPRDHQASNPGQGGAGEVAGLPRGASTVELAPHQDPRPILGEEVSDQATVYAPAPYQEVYSSRSPTEDFGSAAFKAHEELYELCERFEEPSEFRKLVDNRPVLPLGLSRREYIQSGRLVTESKENLLGRVSKLEREHPFPLTPTAFRVLAYTDEDGLVSELGRCGGHGLLPWMSAESFFASSPLTRGLELTDTQRMSLMERYQAARTEYEAAARDVWRVVQEAYETGEISVGLSMTYSSLFLDSAQRLYLFEHGVSSDIDRALSDLHASRWGLREEMERVLR